VATPEWQSKQAASHAGKLPAKKFRMRKKKGEVGPSSLGTASGLSLKRTIAFTTCALAGERQEPGKGRYTRKMGYLQQKKKMPVSSKKGEVQF